MLSPVCYLRGFEIRDLGPIHRLVWELPDGIEGAGWHVLIGDNGSGKSTVLRALALGMLGERSELSLRFDGAQMRRVGSEKGLVELRSTSGIRAKWAPSGGAAGPWQGFHAGFGPVRRFGLHPEQRRLESSDPTAARYASLFSDDWTLGDLVTWLKDLRLDEVDGADGRTLLSSVGTFLNQPGLLPAGASFRRVTSAGPRFEDANGVELGVELLSDGYQSVIGMVLELLRQLLDERAVADVLTPTSGGEIVVGVPGVVLIDEIDAHLHPSWQQRIGDYFTRYFPRFQFVVTTHSPLVCRAAERGSIFRLPRPGADEAGRMVSSEERNRLLYGDVLDAFGTDVFGELLGVD